MGFREQLSKIHFLSKLNPRLCSFSNAINAKTAPESGYYQSNIFNVLVINILIQSFS
jgi:hypothetical protein